MSKIGGCEIASVLTIIPVLPVAQIPIRQVATVRGPRSAVPSGFDCTFKEAVVLATSIADFIRHCSCCCALPRREPGLRRLARRAAAGTERPGRQQSGQRGRPARSRSPRPKVLAAKAPRRLSTDPGRSAGPIDSAVCRGRLPLPTSRLPRNRVSATFRRTTCFPINDQLMIDQLTLASRKK